MPEHSTIQSADCHEPKSITTSTTADTGKVITPSGTTSGTSELRKLEGTELETTGSAEGDFLTVVSGIPTWKAAPGSLFGDMDFRSNTVNTSISTVNVPVLVTGATLTTPGVLFTQGVIDTIVFENTSNNELLKVTDDGVYEVSLSASIQGTTATAKDYLFGIAINGTPVADHARARRTLASASAWGALSLSEYVDLSANDTIQIFVTNETDATNLTVGECSINVILIKAS